MTHLEPDGPADGQPRWQYWPEIDGLRTVAVLSVFLFHLKRSILPGGFVGVDVFFVISGYLISSILLYDIARDRFSIARFYQRRISRIFPALILVVLATFAAGYFIYSAQDLASLGVSSAAAVLSVINFKLLSQGSYFQISADAQPLLHYWSLAVEEQFYVIFPIFLYFLMRLVRRPLAVLLLIAAVSFAACVWLTPIRPTWAFYLLPTRAWELLIGASLALYRAEGGKLEAKSAAGAAWIGAVMIALAVATLNEGAGFPGWMAALPVLGTALLIAPVGEGGPAPLRLLARPWMVAIGKRSYSLYLWHWPVFSFVDYEMFQSGELGRTAVKVAVTLVLTETSYRLVETPARAFLNNPGRRWRLFGGTVAVIAAVAAGGVWLRTSLYYDVPTRLIPRGGFVVAGGNKGSILLSGDSEAAMYGTEIAEIAKEHGLTLYAVGAAGKNQLPDAANTSWPTVARLMAEKKPDLVVLIDNWAEKMSGPEVLQKTIATSLTHTKHVIVVMQPPILPDNVNRENIRNGLHAPYLEPLSARRKRIAALTTASGFAGNRVTVVDVANLFASPDGGVQILAPDNRLAFFDSRHLSDSGTAMTHALLDAAITKGLERR